jgi:DNA polymerase bacteriophage-type
MHAPLPHLATQADTTGTLTAFLDIELRSKDDLRKSGAYKYAADASTEISCAAFVVGNGPVQLWLPGDPEPLEVTKAPRIVAHNTLFEHTVVQQILARRHGWSNIPIERFACTMSMALALGLPAKLGAVADAMELANRKDTAGERLMRLMSRPRKPRKDEDPTGTYYFDDPERLQRLYEYCKQDIEVTRELYSRLARI